MRAKATPKKKRLGAHVEDWVHRYFRETGIRVGKALGLPRAASFHDLLAMIATENLDLTPDGFKQYRKLKTKKPNGLAQTAAVTHYTQSGAV